MSRVVSTPHTLASLGAITPRRKTFTVELHTARLATSARFEVRRQRGGLYLDYLQAGGWRYRLIAVGNRFSLLRFWDDYIAALGRSRFTFYLILSALIIFILHRLNSPNSGSTLMLFRHFSGRLLHIVRSFPFERL